MAGQHLTQEDIYRIFSGCSVRLSSADYMQGRQDFQCAYESYLECHQRMCTDALRGQFPYNNDQELKGILNGLRERGLLVHLGLRPRSGNFRLTSIPSQPLRQFLFSSNAPVHVPVIQPVPIGLHSGVSANGGRIRDTSLYGFVIPSTGSTCSHFDQAFQVPARRSSAIQIRDPVTRQVQPLLTAALESSRRLEYQRPGIQHGPSRRSESREQAHSRGTLATSVELPNQDPVASAVIYHAEHYGERNWSQPKKVIAPPEKLEPLFNSVEEMFADQHDIWPLKPKESPPNKNLSASSSLDHLNNLSGDLPLDPWHAIRMIWT